MKWYNRDSTDNKLEQTLLKIFDDNPELSELSPETIIHGAVPEEVIYRNWVGYLSDRTGVEHSRSSGFSFPSVIHWMNHKLSSGEFIGKRVVRDLVGYRLGMWTPPSCDFIIVDDKIVDRILVLGYVA